MDYSESVYSLNLQPKTGKVYFNSSRKWGEEIIYFLLVDRFHDGKARYAQRGIERVAGYGNGDELTRSCGGNLRGIKNNIDYIQSLGCTSIWLSPVFENNPESYHGYAIENFLNIDPRFGSKDDLIELIDKAHQREMKVFLDCVLNHSGNNWSYNSQNECIYDKGREYPFGDWKKSDRPVPSELRDPNLYQKKGRILNWDKYPETNEGDFFSLKKFKHDESEDGFKLQDILYRIYAYWIQETDCDGFRMDAAKHLGELPLARFSSRIKQFAKQLGKQEFLIFAEIPGRDELMNSFIGPISSRVEDKTYQGPDSFLDFPLHFVLPKVVEGTLPSSKLFDRILKLDRRLTSNQYAPRNLVSFLDNHDQIEKPYKERIGNRLNDEQLIAAIGLLLTLPGVPCLYYGTEQGFTGHGQGDSFIREAMFDLAGAECAHGTESKIFQETRSLIKIRKDHKVLSSGEFKPMIPYLGIDNLYAPKVVSFSRVSKEEDLVIVYNQDKVKPQTFFLRLPRKGSAERVLKYLYGSIGELKPISSTEDYLVFQIEILPLKFLILK